MEKALINNDLDYSPPSVEGRENPSREDETDLSFGVQAELRKLRLGMILGYVFLLPFCLLFKIGMKFWGGYRIEQIQEIRKQFRKIVREPGPMVICPNHLTYIDSAIIIWALAPLWWYSLNYEKFTWNLPAGDHFRKKWIHRVVAFLSKCIYLHRDGSKQHKKAILNTARTLVAQGHLLTIFPEGSRSRTGRVDPEKMTYGVGKMLYNLKDPRVLCIYLRSDQQKTHSAYPAKNSKFYFKMHVLRPKTAKHGKEAYQELVHQVAYQLKDMEDDYFASHAKA